MTMYTKKLRSRMTTELLDAGDQIVIEYTEKRYGMFESFRQTVRYVARSINMRVATDRVGDNLIVTRANPATFTVEYMDQVPRLRFTPRDLQFFTDRMHLLEPKADDPLYDLKNYLFNYLITTKTVLETAMEENEKAGVYKGME